MCGNEAGMRRGDPEMRWGEMCQAVRVYACCAGMRGGVRGCAVTLRGCARVCWDGQIRWRDGRSDSDIVCRFCPSLDAAGVMFWMFLMFFRARIIAPHLNNQFGYC